MYYQSQCFNGRRARKSTVLFTRVKLLCYEPTPVIGTVIIAFIYVYPSRLDDLISILQSKSSSYFLPYALVVNVFDLKTPSDFNSLRIQVIT